MLYHINVMPPSQCFHSHVIILVQYSIDIQVVIRSILRPVKEIYYQVLSVRLTCISSQADGWLVIGLEILTRNV